MPVGKLHDAGERGDVVVGDALVEQVAHRVHEDHLRARPPERLGELLGHQPEVEPLLVGVARDAPEPLGEGLGVAVGASGADLGAAPDGIQRGVRPLDGRMVAHDRPFPEKPRILLFTIADNRDRARRKNRQGRGFRTPPGASPPSSTPFRRLEWASHRSRHHGSPKAEAMTPEELARQDIDRQLAQCGWTVQSRSEMNISAATGVAVREFPMLTGEADYLLYAAGKAIGVDRGEAQGAPADRGRDPIRQVRRGVAPGRPRPPLAAPLRLREHRGGHAVHQPARTRRPEPGGLHLPPPRGTAPARGASTPRSGRTCGPCRRWTARSSGRSRATAIENLEKSLAQNSPRSLIQMATGSGKTFTAVNAAYRLIKFGGARRVLFLVDRSNLGRQTYREFQQFVSPVNGYKFTDEYHVQLLASNTISSTSKVVITTIQRLYSILKGEDQFDETAEEQSLFELDTAAGQGVAAGRLQRAHPHRGVRLPRSSTSATARSTTSGGRSWTTSTPS